MKIPAAAGCTWRHKFICFFHIVKHTKIFIHSKCVSLFQDNSNCCISQKSLLSDYHLCLQEKFLELLFFFRTFFIQFKEIRLVWFGYFVSWHINFCRLFNAKAILQEEQYWNNLTHSWEDKGVHTFSKGICPKVNVIARLEFELVYFDFAVHRFNHSTTTTPPEIRFITL